MRKPDFAYFYGLCILISFSLLTITVRGYQISIAYCLFSFSLSSPMSREATVTHLSIYLKGTRRRFHTKALVLLNCKMPQRAFFFFLHYFAFILGGTRQTFRTIISKIANGHADNFFRNRRLK